MAPQLTEPGWALLTQRLESINSTDFSDSPEPKKAKASQSQDCIRRAFPAKPWEQPVLLFEKRQIQMGSGAAEG